LAIARLEQAQVSRDGGKKVKRRYVWNLSSTLLAALVFGVCSAKAQTIAYRQTNLSSDVPGTANHTDLALRNPWGIAFNPGLPFFIASNNGRVISEDTSGALAAPGGFIVPNPAGNGSGSLPIGIVADPNSFFGGGGVVQPFITATQDGGLYLWGVDARGDIPTAATLVVDHSQSGALYTGLQILNPACCAPFLAVANFRSGLVETYAVNFSPLAPPGSFVDPNLPVGYAPFGMRIIGNQVFVAYAVQDAAKQNPVFGVGNGIVDIFDLEGNFVRRFATGGALNAPWGIIQATASFGPFSNDILVGNFGDGTINAFDSTTGNFVGQLRDGDGTAILEDGLHALAFRADGFGNPNTLYFTAGVNNGQDGLFGAITTGLVTTTRASAPTTPTDSSARITAMVMAAPGNSGNPSGTVTFLDGSSTLGTAPLVNGSVDIEVVLSGVGTHNITARYRGDAIFLFSTSNIGMQVTALPTTLNLTAPASAAPGSTILLTATANSTGGIPTGQIIFHDGNANLATVPLDGTGSATFRTNTLAVGAHTLSASYAGDEKFGPSLSAAMTLDISNPDFSLMLDHASASVVAGQSTEFQLTVTPAGGFANNVSFSCSQIAGITCAFNPATVTPANGAATTTLTVTTSAIVSRYGLLPIDLVGPAYLFAVVTLCSFGIWHGRKLHSSRPSLLTATALLALVGLSLAVGGCGGYGANVQPNRGTAAISVIAQSVTISHSKTVDVTVK
jgi:uncharacterized protein (TIGR03118 family)